MSERGQATVELVALVPLIVAVAFAVAAALAAGRASSAAGGAAEAAAVAMLQGGSGADAARRSLAGHPRGSTSVRISGGRVRVTVRPALPVFAGLLTATAEADAGRAAPPASPLLPIRGGDGAGSAPPALAAPASATAEPGRAASSGGGPGSAPLVPAAQAPAPLGPGGAGAPSGGRRAR